MTPQVDQGEEVNLVRRINGSTLCTGDGSFAQDRAVTMQAPAMDKPLNGREHESSHDGLAMAFAVAAPGIAFGADKAEDQAEVRKAGQDALAAVYKAQPSARGPSSRRPATPRSATSA